MKVKLLIKYILFLYILAISGWEFFYRVSNTATYLLFPFVLLLFLFYKKRLDRGVLYLLPFVLIFLIQVFLYKIPSYFPLTFFIRVFTVYLVAKIIDKDLIVITVSSVKAIAFFSLLFYISLHIGITNYGMLQLSSYFTNLASNPDVVVDWPNFVVYTITPKPEDFFLYRNSGPFREPGLYVVFLIIALFFNSFSTRKIISKTNLILIISILSTFSTTGYIVLLLFFLLFVTVNKTLKLRSRILFFVFVVTLVPVFYSLPFIGDKVQEQSSQTDISYSRFGALIVHLNILKDFPLTGLPYDSTSYSNYTDNISPNGISEIFVRFGYIVGVFFYLLLYRASKVITESLGYRKVGYSLFLVIFTLLFSQTIGTSPFFWLLILSHSSFVNNFRFHKNKKNYA